MQHPWSGWSPEEEATLIGLWGEAEPAELEAALPGRTFGSISQHARDLLGSPGRGTYSWRGAARLSGYCVTALKRAAKALRLRVGVRPHSDPRFVSCNRLRVAAMSHEQFEAVCAWLDEHGTGNHADTRRRSP